MRTPLRKSVARDSESVSFQLPIFLAIVLTLGTVTSTAAWAQPWRGPVALGIEVQDQDGNPVPGAEVRLEYAEVEPYSGPPPLTTDAAGRAEVFGLAEGLWRVQIDKPEYSRYLVVLRLDPRKKKVLITAGPLRDATAPPLEVEFVKSESRVARGDRPREETKKERKKQRKKDRKKDRERSGRISASEAEEPESPPQPPVRTVPEKERRPETPSRPPEPEPESEPPTETPPETQPEPPAPEPEVEREPEPAPPSEPSATVEPEQPPAPPEPVTEAEEAEPQPAEAATGEAVTQETEPEAETVPAPSAPPEPVRRRDRDAEKPVRLDQEAGPPPATSDVRTYESGTCSDCRPGEAATKALAVAGKSTGGGCPAGFLGDTETALETLGAAMNRRGYTGPLVVDGQVVALAPEPERSRVQQRLASYIAPGSPCQLLIVVLSREVKFTGYRYEARQGSRGGDCLAGQDCPIGGARWPDHPTIQRTDEATFVYALFENRTDAERVAELTAYFDPTP